MHSAASLKLALLGGVICLIGLTMVLCHMRYGLSVMGAATLFYME